MAPKTDVAIDSVSLSFALNPKTSVFPEASLVPLSLESAKGVGTFVAEGLGVGVKVGLGVTVGLGVGEGVGVEEGDGVGVGVEVGSKVGVGGAWLALPAVGSKTSKETEPPSGILPQLLSTSESL